MGKDFTKVGEHGSLEILRLETEPFGTNAYLLICGKSGESLLIDAPGEAEQIAARLAGTQVQFIVITHGHRDHLPALEELRHKLKAPVAVHPGDAARLPVKADRLLADGDKLKCGEEELEVIHTPGHTPGGICLLAGDNLLAGDTIFPGGPGKTAAPVDFEQVMTSIRKRVLTLPDRVQILPGHGAESTVGAERKLIEAFLARGPHSGLYGEVTWQ